MSGVFHELNNLLQVIGGPAELIQDAPGCPAASPDGLRIQASNAKAAARLPK